METPRVTLGRVLTILEGPGYSHDYKFHLETMFQERKESLDRTLESYLRFVSEQKEAWIRSFPSKSLATSTMGKVKSAFLKLLKQSEEVRNDLGAEACKKAIKDITDAWAEHGEVVANQRQVRAGGAQAGPSRQLPGVAAAPAEIQSDALDEEDSDVDDVVEPAQVPGDGGESVSETARLQSLLRDSREAVRALHRVVADREREIGELAREASNRATRNEELSRMVRILTGAVKTLALASDQGPLRDVVGMILDGVAP